MMEPSERLEESTLQIPLSSTRTIGVFCTSKILGDQDRVFFFLGGLANDEELQNTL
jgi:hypothetical protein